jgi:hypothetical protein
MNDMKRPSNKKREQLRAEYKSLPHTVSKLEWCTEKARSLGMSYGAFAAWLNI